MVVIITIQGVLTKSNSKKSNTDLIPIVIAVNKASPLLPHNQIFFLPNQLI